MNYIRREETLEAMATRAICEGFDFANSYARSGPRLRAFYQRSLYQTLARLEGGDVCDPRDDDCISAMGDALVNAANEISPGYGNRVLNVCTHEDFLFNKELEDLRWLILRWESFHLVRRQIRAKLTAKRLLAAFEEGD